MITSKNICLFKFSFNQLLIFSFQICFFELLCEINDFGHSIHLKQFLKFSALKCFKWFLKIFFIPNNLWHLMHPMVLIQLPHYASGPMWGVQFGLGRSWQDSRFKLWLPYGYIVLQKKNWAGKIWWSWGFTGLKVFLLNGLNQCFAGFMVLLLSRFTERIELWRHSAPWQWIGILTS